MELEGLHLGMDKQEFVATVGGDFHWEDGKGYAFFESRRKPTQAELLRLPEDDRSEAMLNVDVSVIGSFVEGKLAEIEVWKVETY